MKEIDLLPEWYKSGKHRRFTYRTQYVVLGAIFAVIMVWNFVSSYSISKASAELVHLKSQAQDATCISQEYDAIKAEMAELQEKSKFIDEINSKIDVANILAEMSFLINERVVLNKVELNAEKISSQEQQAGNRTAGLRLARGRSGVKDMELLLGEVGFKVVISGVAANASDVAELICKLEESPYFCKVVPSFSRNTELKTPNSPLLQSHAAAGEGKLPASEFEITCWVANYQEK